MFTATQKKSNYFVTIEMQQQTTFQQPMLHIYQMNLSSEFGFSLCRCSVFNHPLSHALAFSALCYCKRAKPSSTCFDKQPSLSVELVNDIKNISSNDWNFFVQASCNFIITIFAFGEFLCHLRRYLGL